MSGRARTAEALLAAGMIAAGAAPPVAADAANASATGHLTIRVVNSPAGGDPGYFYVGGPIDITVKGRAPKPRFELCMTPPPTDRPSCLHGRVGHTISGLAPSRAGLTKLRVDFGTKVVVRHIRVREPD